MEHEYCEACGFDGAHYNDALLLESLRALGPRWQTLLEAAGPDLRVRPEPEVWSAIEYAAHSRDITALHVYGIEQALTRDEPVFPQIADDLVDSAATDIWGGRPGRCCRRADHSGFAACQRRARCRECCLVTRAYHR